MSDPSSSIPGNRRLAQVDGDDYLPAIRWTGGRRQGDSGDFDRARERSAGSLQSQPLRHPNIVTIRVRRIRAAVPRDGYRGERSGRSSAGMTAASPASANAGRDLCRLAPPPCPRRPSRSQARQHHGGRDRAAQDRDFGIARSLQPTSRDTQARHAELHGPERFMGIRIIAATSAIGAVATSARISRRSTAIGVLGDGQIVLEQPPPLTDVCPDLDPAIVAIVSKASKDLAPRQDVESMRADITPRRRPAHRRTPACSRPGRAGHAWRIWRRPAGRSPRSCSQSAGARSWLDARELRVALVRLHQARRCCCSASESVRTGQRLAVDGAGKC